MKHKRLIVLLLATAYVAATSRVFTEPNINNEQNSLPKKMSQAKNNTLNKKGREIKKISEDIHSNMKEIDKKIAYFAPKFKNPTKLYHLELEPAGNSVRLRCAAEGNPTPNITWYKDNKTPILRSYFQVVYDKWSMNIEELTKMDNGKYTCVVCNQLGCINHTTELIIQGCTTHSNVPERYPSKPYIKEGHPGNVTVLLYENVTLTCPPVSDLEPYLYWLRPHYGPEGTYTESTVIESQNPEDLPEQLTIYNVTKDDEGWYVCVAINALGNTSAKGFLTVLESAPLQEAPEQDPRSEKSIPILASIFAGVLLVAGIVVVATCRKLKREMKQKRLALETARDVIESYWKKKVTIEKPQINNSPNAGGALVLPVIKIEKQKVTEVKKNSSDTKLSSEYELPLDVDWEVPRETVVLGKVLGEGEFGKVVKAECVGVLKRGQSIAAVKMLKDGHTDAEMTALVSEMEIMKVVGKHVNIINLLGCCTQDGPLYVIVEFAPHGSLKEFLQTHRPGNKKATEVGNLDEKRHLTPQNLVSFAYQAAKGMEYLASRHCIHRDLAARNILVSDNFVLKIADFGLAKNIENEDYYRKKTAGKLPVRWMAPESLNSMLFTIQSDVWSFGVLLWEIMTLGATPYRTVQGQYMYQYLRAGHRLEKPPRCRLDLYLLMRECWSLSPRGRPSFTQLVRELDKILTSISNQEYVDLSLPESESSQVTETRWLSNKEIAR